MSQGRPSALEARDPHQREEQENRLPALPSLLAARGLRHPSSTAPADMSPRVRRSLSISPLERAPLSAPLRVQQCAASGNHAGDIFRGSLCLCIYLFGKLGRFAGTQFSTGFPAPPSLPPLLGLPDSRPEAGPGSLVQSRRRSLPSCPPAGAAHPLLCLCRHPWVLMCLWRLPALPWQPYLCGRSGELPCGL